MADINIQKILLSIVLLIVAIIIVFTIIGETSGDIRNAAINLSGDGANITGAGLPLTNLFSSNGVLLIVFMVAIFIGMLTLSFKALKGTK